MNQYYDVIIIGAGAAGLRAAKELRKYGKSICILEARDRTGGRIKAGKIGENAIELGAGWTNQEQLFLLSEAQEYGYPIQRQYAKGNSILDLNHSMSFFNSEQFGLSFLANFSLNKAMRTLEHNAMTVQVDQPWKCDHAREWDSQTLQNWINQNIKNPQARSYFETSVTIELSIEPSKISYLYFLQLVRADQLLEKEPAGVEGAWSYVIEGGMSSLFSAIAHDLKDCIHLDQAVYAIEQNENDISAKTASNCYTGKYCIMAIPPVFASRIDFSPSFSARRSMLIQSMPMGSAIKSFIRYNTPFWRQDDLSGIIISNTAPFVITLDISPNDQSYGMITAMACGADAVELSALDQSQRREVLIKQLTAYFGENAQNPLDYTDNDWATERWSQSGYSGYLPPGMLTVLKGEISYPSGRIHWAGTETAVEWHGAVEGALRSGVRAANEVLEKMGIRLK